jgi:glycosyltransferase involved in cell wall biosynthesis
MKIAQVSATFPPYMAGTGNACYNHAVELAARGHDVSVFTSRIPNIPCTYPSTIKVNRIRPLFRIGNAPFIPSLMNIRNFDIIHLHYPFFFGGDMIYLLSKLTRQNYVISYHNDVILSGGLKPFLTGYKRTLMPEILKNAKKIIVTSIDYGKNCELSNYSDDFIDAIVEVPFGVDTTTFNPDVCSDDIIERYHLSNKKIILFVAALDSAHYFKGLDILLESFSHINTENARLLIIGDGDLKNHYINRSKDLGIFNRVIFAGGISNLDLPKFYACADMLILPSISTESFGLVLTEAMASGKPVIASNIPGVRTVVDNGVNGLLVQPGDVNDLTTKINFLLNNADICKSYGREGRKKTEKKYNWRKNAETLESIYLTIIGEKR